MQELENFVQSFYQLLDAQPQSFIQLKSQIKFHLSQLYFQYNEILDEQQKYNKKPSTENNLINSFLFQNQNSQNKQMEQNELVFCKQIQEFLKKLRKSQLENQSDLTYLKCLIQDVEQIKQISSIIHPISPLHQTINHLYELLNKMERLVDYEKGILKCPLRPAHVINKEIAEQLIKQDQKLIEQLNQSEIVIKRIANTDVFYYQRYLLSYVLRSTIFDLSLPPGFVIRLTTFEQNKNNKERKKQYIYLFVTQKVKDDYLNLNVANKAEFAKNYLSLLCTDYLDHLIPNYYGNLISQYENEISSKTTMYEQFRNPLFYFKREIQENRYSPQEFEEFRPKYVFEMFINFLNFLSNTQLNDFHHKKDVSRFRFKSLQITSDMLSLSYQRIKKLEDTLIFAQEVLFPQQLYVRLSDIAEKLNQVAFQFQRLDITKFNTLSEYTEYLKKIDLEELVHKIIDNKVLTKYNNQIRPAKIDLNFIEHQSQNEYQDKSILFQCYANSPKNIIIVSLQKLDIQYEISLTNRIKTLDFLASIHFYIETIFTTRQEQIFDSIISKFNESWFNIDLWKQAFNSNYSIQSQSQFNNQFFVELLAILFFKEKYKTLNLNIFQSLVYVEENKENCKIITYYLLNKYLNNDFGYNEHITIAECALKNKKFYFLSKLLQNNQGQKIHFEYFDYLLDQPSNLFSQSIYFSSLSENDTKYHLQIFDEIAKIHPELESRLRWDHFWNQKIRLHDTHQIKLISRGIWGLTKTQFDMIFNVNQLSNKGEIPNYLELNLNAVINQNKNKNFSVLKVEDNYIGHLLFLQPNYPLQKFMACLLHRLLQLDQYSSKVELAQLDQQVYSIYEVIDPYRDNFKTKLTIAQFFQHNNDDELILQRKIGNYNLANKIVLSILFLSSTTSPDQELLVPCGNYLAPVSTNFYLDPRFDNFINSHGFERIGDKVQLCCYNIYFLMQFMKEKIDYSLLKNFSQITLTLQQWLKQLSQLEVQASESLGLLVLPLNKENMIELVRRANIIENLIKHSDHITYLDLLKLCEKNLGDLYQILLENPAHNLLDKFLHIKQISTNTENLTLSDFISFRESFAYVKYPFGFSLRNVIGPYKGLKMCLKYSRFLSQTSLQDLRKKLSVVKKSKHFQMLLKNFEWRHFKEKEIQDAFQILSEYSLDYNRPFEFLNFKHLQSKLFPTYFSTLQLVRIKILNLSHIESVNDNFLFEIAQHCTELHVLNISGCPNIQYIGYQMNILNIGTHKSLVFQRLKTLIAQSLSNLKSVEISGQYIQNLNFNHCKNLQTVYTNKVKLQRVQIQGCKLLQEDIVQIWILQGIKLLFDEQTSAGAFKGFIQPKIIIDVEQSYCYERQYQEVIFQLLGDVYEKIVLPDINIKSPITQFLIKNGICADDIVNQLQGFLNNKFDEMQKKKVIYGLFYCFFQNKNIKALDFKSMLKNRGQERKKLLQQFIIDLTYVINQSILTDDTQQKVIVKSFFENIEQITIPYGKEAIIDEISKLIKQVQQFRSSISISFANLKTIENNIIKQFLSKVQRTDKALHINQLDFSCNSLEKENLENIFSDSVLCMNIQQLILRNAGIEDRMLIAIAEKLWNCENLKLIDLSQNLLTKESINQLLLNGQKLVKLPLNTLNLSENKIGDSNFGQLCEIEQNQWQNDQKQMLYLKSIILKNCFDETHNIESFCEYVEKSYTLSVLDLRQNSFSDQGVKMLSQAIGKSKSINTLLYQNNAIVQQSIIIDDIMKAQSLVHFEIILNHLGHYNEQFVRVFNNSNLKTLAISLPTINEEKMAQIEKKIRENISIIKFTFDVTDLKVQNRTFYKLSKLKIQNLMEIKELSKQDQFLIDSFYKQDTLRIDVQDYSQLGLSIDGGGIRGLMPATIINYLCSEIKKEPHQIFDCIGGTSIGGILALAMTGTKDGHHPLADKDQLISFFTEDGKTIFDDSKRGVWSIISKSKYDAKGIESVLQKYAGTVKLSETLPHTNVIVTAVKLQKQKGDSMAKVFSSRMAKLDLTENFLIKDVGRATSAAPTYFPAAQIKSLSGKDYQFIDGGVGKNNPAELVLQDLRKGMLNKEQDNFFLLSVSTGISKQKQHLQADEGILGVVRILDAFGESNQDFVDLELQKNKGKYLRIVPEYNLPESQAQLDCTDAKILEEYTSAATEVADQIFNQEKFGKYQDKSFIRWLEENTARKLESQ